MSATKHEPLPWSQLNDKPNAELIVRAVNNHEALVSALRESLHALAHKQQPSVQEFVRWCAVLVAAETEGDAK